MDQGPLWSRGVFSDSALNRLSIAPHLPICCVYRSWLQISSCLILLAKSKAHIYTGSMNNKLCWGRKIAHLILGGHLLLIGSQNCFVLASSSVFNPGSSSGAVEFIFLEWCISYIHLVPKQTMYTPDKPPNGRRTRKTNTRCEPKERTGLPCNVVDSRVSAGQNDLSRGPLPDIILRHLQQDRFRMVFLEENSESDLSSSEMRHIKVELYDSRICCGSLLGNFAFLLYCSNFFSLVFFGYTWCNSSEV